MIRHEELTFIHWCCSYVFPGNPSSICFFNFYCITRDRLVIPGLGWNMLKLRLWPFVPYHLQTHITDVVNVICFVLLTLKLIPDSLPAAGNCPPRSLFCSFPSGVYSWGLRDQHSLPWDLRFQGLGYNRETMLPGYFILTKM